MQYYDVSYCKLIQTLHGYQPFETLRVTLARVCFSQLCYEFPTLRVSSTQFFFQNLIRFC